MHEAYVSAGFPPGRFWSITPRLYLMEMRGAGARLDREHRERAWLAHTVAVLGRVDAKKFPSLDDMTRPKPKTADGSRMLEIAMRWNDAVNRRPQ
jgi:hypothetical protein